MCEQIERAVHHILDLGILAVDLIGHHDRLVTEGKGFAEHEGGLRHRTFLRVYEQEHAVHHAERPLDFAAEIRVPRGIHNVDLDPVVHHAGVLRFDGDPALALLVHGV